MKQKPAHFHPLMRLSLQPHLPLIAARGRSHAKDDSRLRRSPTRVSWGLHWHWFYLKPQTLAKIPASTATTLLGGIVRAPIPGMRRLAWCWGGGVGLRLRHVDTRVWGVYVEGGPRLLKLSTDGHWDLHRHLLAASATVVGARRYKRSSNMVFWLYV